MLEGERGARPGRNPIKEQGRGGRRRKGLPPLLLLLFLLLLCFPRFCLPSFPLLPCAYSCSTSSGDGFMKQSFYFYYRSQRIFCCCSTPKGLFLSNGSTSGFMKPIPPVQQLCRRRRGSCGGMKIASRGAKFSSKEGGSLSTYSALKPKKTRRNILRRMLERTH